MPDLVALDVPGGEAFVDLLRQVWDRGDAVLPLDQRLPRSARRALLEAMAPAEIIGAAGSRSRLEGGRPVADGDALVIPTSGSTGTPKGVVLTHDALRASARAGSERLQVDPATDRWLSCLPLSHMGGLGVITRSIHTGVPVEVLAGFDRDAVEAAARRGATLTTLVPTTLRRVDPLLFRAVVVGGADVPPDLPGNAVVSYGLTETGGGCVYDGVPFDGVEVKVGDDGEIRVRGPVLLRCYRDDTVPLDGDGWLPTGDAGAWDGHGRLTIHGRLSDLIITGGENVWPAPVEDLLRTLPGVAEVGVVGRPDPEWGERVVAVVEVADGAEPPMIDEARAAVKERLHPAAAPKEVVVVDALPRTPSGKIHRSALRAALPPAS